MSKLSLIVFLIPLAISLCFASAKVIARDLVVSIAELPDLVIDADNGPFVELVKAIDYVYNEGSIKREVYPFKRSINNVVEGKADFHIPLIKNPLIDEDSLPYRYVSIPACFVDFVIYSNVEKPITREDIDRASKSSSAFPYKILTLAGHADFFDFPVKEIFDFENALKRVNLKRVDAIILPMEESDSTIRKYRLKNVHRELYENFDAIIVILRGEKGDELEAILTNALEKLKSNGKLEELYNNIHKPFTDWQPSKEFAQ